MFSYLAVMTLGSAHEFCPHGRMESPLNKLFTLGGRLFNPPRRKHMLKRAESHRCEVNTLGTFACNFSMIFKVSQSDSFWQITHGVTDFSQGNFLKRIEYVCYSIKYCQISLLIYIYIYIQGAVAFQAPGVFLTHLV